MAERGPLAEVDTNVMGTPSFTGDKGVPSLGKVAHPDESLLPGKDSLTGEGSIEYSGLGHAALNSFLPETEQLKREDWDDFKEVKMEYEEQRFCSEGGDAEMENVDKDTSRESLKEKVEKPDIVRNLLGQQKEVTSTDSYSRSALKVLKALGLEPGCGDPLVGANLLPGSAKGVVADSVASFLIFIRTRYFMFEARQWEEEHQQKISPVFRDLHFTNIHREADTGTRYLRRRLIGRSKEEMVLSIVVYRTVNRIETFEEYQEKTGSESSLPSRADLKAFVKFIKWKREKVFTNAHQALSVDKVEDIFNHVLSNLADLTSRLLDAANLEEAFHLIKDINYLGDFYAYQIVSDMVEIGLLKFSEDSWTCLGPGAHKGLQEVRAEGMFNVGDQELVRRLARIADYGLPHLGEQPVRFLNRRLSVKAVEHSLCEFFKFTRAAKNGVERGRRYKPRKRLLETCDNCQGNRGGRDWKECILCSRSFHTECLEDWRSTTMDFFLCEPCYSIEVVKGSSIEGVFLEDNQPKIKQSFVSLKKLRL